MHDNSDTRDAIPAGFFILRTPVLPVSFKTGVAASPCPEEGLNCVGFGTEVGSSADASNGASRILKNDLFRGILMSASASLLAAADHELETAGALTHETELAIARYRLRMSTRSTPYGLLAGVTFGEVAGYTNLKLASLSSSSATLRLEALTCHRLLRMIRDALRETGELRVVTNPTAVERLDEFHFLADVSGETRRAVVRRSRLVDAIVSLAKADTTIATLENELFKKASPALHGKIRDGISQAIKSSLLSVVVDDDLDDESVFVQLATLLVQVAPSNPLALAANRILAVLRSSASTALAYCADRQILLDETVRAAFEVHESGSTDQNVEFLGDTPAVNVSDTHGYWDLRREGTPTISGTLANELLASVGHLAVLADHWSDSVMDRFVERFVARFETRPVPLLQALDEFAGVPFASEATLFGKSNRLSAREVEYNEVRTRALASMLDEWRRNGSANELTIDAECLERFRVSRTIALGSSFAVHAILLNVDSEKPEESRFYVRSVITGNAAITIGRFTHLDNRVRMAIDEQLASTSDDGRLHADIAWLPESRASNIMRRRTNSACSISIGHYIRSTIRGRLDLDDLFLRYSNGRLALFSARLEAEVCPRFSTAYNYRVRTNPVVRFLAMQQASGQMQSFQWGWGPFSHLPQLPRVRSGSAVLSARTWCLTTEDQAALRTSRRIDRPAVLRQIRERLCLPRHVMLIDGENEVPVDLESRLADDLFIRRARIPSLIRLTEDLSMQYPRVAHANGEPYAHEIVVPFRAIETRVIAPKDAGDFAAIHGETISAASLVPLSGEWAYFRIFCARAAVPSLLRQCRLLVTNFGNLIDQWFFVCYPDPEYHIRFRINAASSLLWGTLAPRLSNMLAGLQRARIVERYEIAPYEPELLRYGGERGLQVVERIFHRDSEFTLELLHSGFADVSENVSDAVLIATVVVLTAQLREGVNSQLELLAFWQSSGSDASSAKEVSQRALGRRLRACRRLVDALLIHSVPSASSIDEDTLSHGVLKYREPLSRYRDALSRLIVESRGDWVNDDWNRFLELSGASIGHMCMNRKSFFRSSAGEVTTVGLTAKYLVSAEAKEGRVVAWMS